VTYRTSDKPLRWSGGHDAPWPVPCGKSRPAVHIVGSGRLTHDWGKIVGLPTEERDWGRRCWPCMPRYFFHLTNGDSVADEVGEEFDVVEAARAHAIAVARELSGNRVPDDFVGCYISVVDERGVVVFKVPL
jgi:hypothetical protein